MIESGIVKTEIGRPPVVPGDSKSRASRYGERISGIGTIGKAYSSFATAHGVSANIISGSSTAYNATRISAALQNSAGESSRRILAPKWFRFLSSDFNGGVTGINVGIVVDSAVRLSGLTGDKSNSYDSGDMHEANFGRTIGSPFMGARTVGAEVSPRRVAHSVAYLGGTVSIGEEILVEFGGLGQRGMNDGAASAYGITLSMPPVTISPGYAMFVHIWVPGMGAGPIGGEAELHWEET